VPTTPTVKFAFTNPRKRQETRFWWANGNAWNQAEGWSVLTRVAVVAEARP